MNLASLKAREIVELGKIARNVRWASLANLLIMLTTYAYVFTQGDGWLEEESSVLLGLILFGASLLAGILNLFAAKMQAFSKATESKWAGFTYLPFVYFVGLGGLWANDLLSKSPDFAFFISLLTGGLYLVQPTAFNGFFYALGRNWGDLSLQRRAKNGGLLGGASLLSLIFFWQRLPDPLPDHLWLASMILVPVVCAVLSLLCTAHAASIVTGHCERIAGENPPDLRGVLAKTERSLGQRFLLAVLLVAVPAGLLTQAIAGFFWLGFVVVLLGLPCLLAAHFQRINELRYRKCDYPQALRELKIWKLIIPRQDYFLLRANICASAHQFDDCLQVIHEPAFLGHKKQNALASYAQARRDWSAAEAHFREGLELCPPAERVIYLLDLASHLARRHPEKMQEAFRYWDEAQTLPVQKSLEPILFCIEALLWIGAEEPLVAQQILDAHIPKLESESKNNPIFVPVLADAYVQYGRACGLLGQTCEAFAYLTRAIETNSSPSQATEVQEQARILEKGEQSTFEDTALDFSTIRRRKEAFVMLDSWPGGSV